MYKDKKVTAIITAAGKGSRMGASLPKQFLKIGSKTILEKAIQPFQKADCVDQIIVVSERTLLTFAEISARTYRKLKM